jgi:hypothetical protein
MEVYQLESQQNGYRSMYIRLETIPESNPRIMRHEAELQELKMTPIRP